MTTEKRLNVSRLVVRTIVLVLAVLAEPSMAADDTEADECPISCLNGSVCKKGSADYSSHPTTFDGSPFFFQETASEKGWYCDCPDGWTGIRCGREYEVCDDQDTDDPHTCYHGGKCIAQDGAEGDKPKYICSCNDASHDKHPYVGKYCESMADYCEPDNPDMDDKFCANGGTCKDDYATALEPCHCPPEYHGIHCDFHKQQKEECQLDCFNQGVCQHGVKSYQADPYNTYWESHENLEHCVCPEGFFGPRCGIVGVTCGTEHCFNGGKCVETIDASGNTVSKCDCVGAHAGIGAASPGTGPAFAGEHCHAQATKICSAAPQHNGRLFCANGGTCKGGPASRHLGCDCPEGFKGPSCEYRDEHHYDESDCKLQCQNGGKCRRGFKDISFNEQFGPELDHFDFNMTHNEDWEHCVCPDNYFGIKCEHEIQVCDGENHVCLHGSQCVPIDEVEGNQDSNGDDRKLKRHRCDCDQGFDAIDMHAGKFCQYTSTDICTSHHQPGAGKSKFAFCVNNGRCKGYVEDNEEHPGCECPDGYEGVHCEYLEGRAPTKSEEKSPASNGIDEKSPASEGSSSSDARIVVAGVVLSVAVVAALVAGFLMRRRQNRLLKGITDVTLNAEDTNVSSSTEGSDLDAPNHGGVGVEKTDSVSGDSGITSPSSSGAGGSELSLTSEPSALDAVEIL